MRIDWWTLALQAINVLILVWLLGRFLFRPVAEAIAARQAAANTILADAQAAKDDAVAQSAALKARNEDFSAEVEQRRADLKASIEDERARLLEKVKSEADTLARQADIETEAERAGMRTELQEKAGVLAARIAERLLDRLPATAVTDLLFDALLDRIRPLPADERQELASENPLKLVTATAIDEVTRRRYIGDLEKALGEPVGPQFAVEPALVAGFELRGPHVQVRNSWRADLDDILAELRKDDHARIR